MPGIRQAGFFWPAPGGWAGWIQPFSSKKIRVRCTTFWTAGALASTPSKVGVKTAIAKSDRSRTSVGATVQKSQWLFAPGPAAPQDGQTASPAGISSWH